MKTPEDLVRAIRSDLLEQQLFHPCAVCAAVSARAPHDLATERIVLMQVVQPAVPRETFAGLSPEHFYNPHLRQIASVLLPTVGASVDELVELLASTLVEGAAYWRRFLGQLYMSEPLLASPDEVRGHVERLLVLAKRRRLRVLGQSFLALLDVETADDAALLDQLRQTAAVLKAAT